MSDIAESTEVTEGRFEKPKPPKAKAKKKEPTILSQVQAVIKAVAGYAAKFNNARTVAVVDLGMRAGPQGSKFRQLYVEPRQGMITISLQEGFKSMHGGEGQRKVINAFSVPVTEFEAFDLLMKRFFNYKPNDNLSQAAFLVDSLQQTVGS